MTINTIADVLKKCRSSFGLLLLPGLLFGQAETPSADPAGYQEVAQQLIVREEYQEAMEVYQTALHEFEQQKDWTRYYAATLAQGKLYLKLKDYQASRSLMESALSSYANHGMDSLGLEQGELYQILAESHYLQNHLPLAQKWAEMALNIFERQQATHLIEPVKRLLGKTLCLMNDSGRGVALLEESVIFLKQDEKNNLQEIGRCLTLMGNYYLTRYTQLEKGLDYFQQSLDYSTRAKDSLVMRLNYSRMALCYSQLRNPQPALEYAFKGLDMAIQFEGPASSSAGFAYNVIGNVFRLREEHEKSLEYWNLSYETFYRSEGLMSPNTVGMLMNKGAANKNMGQYEAALKIYQEVIDLQKGHKSTSNDDVKVHRNMGNVYLLMGDKPRAHQKFLDAKKNAEQSLALNSLIWVELNLDLAATATTLSEAEMWTQKAFQLCVENKDSLDQLETQDFFLVNNPFYLLPVIQAQTTYAFQGYGDSQKLADLLRADRFAAKGIELIDHVWRTQASAESKLELMQLSRAHLEVAARVKRTLYEQTQTRQILDGLLNIIEKHKSLLLTEALTAKQTKTDLGIPEAMLQRETELLELIAAEKQLLLRPGQKQQDSIAVFNRLFDFSRRLAALHDELATNYPQYRQIHYDFSDVSASRIQSYLPNNHTALIEYFFDTDGLIILAYTKEQIQFFYQPLDTTFYDQMTTLRQFVEQPQNFYDPSTLQSRQTLFQHTAHKLYQKLLQPVLDHLPELDQLIIVPDGKIGYLPFELLLSDPVGQTVSSSYRDLPFVIKDYTIQYEYAYKLLAREVLPRKSPPKGLLAMAPRFQEGGSGQSMRGEMDSLIYDQSFPGLRKGFAPLRLNILEAENISTTVHGQVLTGEAATVTAFKQQAQQYGVLHLATHAFVNDLYPDYSHLVFAQQKDSTSSRFLYAYELYQMQLNANLAVLSACETGMGKLQSGEGIMSLSRAFKYAGCPNIITSLWQAEDQSTQQIMLAFYDYLKQGMGKADALRQAKLDFLASAEQRFIHPFYWGAFILIGDNASIQIGDPKRSVWTWSAGLLLIGCLALWWWKKYGVAEKKAG